MSDESGQGPVPRDEDPTPAAAKKPARQSPRASGARTSGSGASGAARAAAKSSTARTPRTPRASTAKPAATPRKPAAARKPATPRATKPAAPRKAPAAAAATAATEELVVEQGAILEAVAQEAPVEEAPTPEVVVEKPVPEESVPEESVPEDSVPEDSVAEEPVPGRQVVEEAVLEEAVLEEAVLEEALLEAVVPEASVVERTAAEERPAENDPAENDPAGKDTAGGAPAEKETAEKETAEKDASGAASAQGAPEVQSEPATGVEPVLVLETLTKRFGDHLAVDGVTLSLDPGTVTGIVGPNGAGKTTTLSMITGLLRPTSGRVLVAGADVWTQPRRAKRQLGVLPDRLHTFDRLTGGQLLYYTGVLHGLDRGTARRRTTELAEAFKVEHAMGRLVTDYSSGMLKKIALAAALVHGPRLLVLDEPFESVDPVSAMTVAQILRDYAAGGGTVLLSSHSMELVQRICDHVAVIVDGRLIAGGTVDEVRGDRSLEERFIDLAGADEESIADLTWLHRF